MQQDLHSQKKEKGIKHEIYSYKKLLKNVAVKNYVQVGTRHCTAVLFIMLTISCLMHVDVPHPQTAP